MDLCSGSGAIPLALKDECPKAEVRGLEVSPEAWAWATANRDRLGLDVDLALGDATQPCFDDWAGSVDVVTINPPYIPVGAVPLDPEVRDHDPEIALYGGSEDGLAIPLAVVRVAPGLLRPGGLVLVEHADSQGESLPRRDARDGGLDRRAGPRRPQRPSTGDVPPADRRRPRTRLRAVSERYDCTDPSGRAEGVPAAAGAIRRGEVIVLPTDTVYGIGCDAFDATAVASVLAAKGRGRDMPPPVLIPTARTAQGLATAGARLRPAADGEVLAGPLTVVLQAQTSLHWDLGDTNGTVALRVPDHDLTLELLGDVGPMAVTSANTTGDPAARTVDEAGRMLGESVRSTSTPARRARASPRRSSTARGRPP